jgi:energy-coupling factor transporter transmembrane protein EcfT
LFALYAVLRIWYGGRRSACLFILAGFFSALTAGFELPAAAFVALILFVLLLKAPGRTLTLAVPAALVPVAAAILTNYLAIGSIRPAYMDFGVQGGPYDYPGSYWMPNEYWLSGPTGIDALHEPKSVYLAHLLIGHHGFFLLTPVFIIALFGVLAHLFRRDERARPGLAVLVLLLTGAVVALYTVKTNNYAGGSQGPRWLFWLIPFWLVMLPAGVELFARRRIGRFVCYLFMAVSLFSVAWATPQIDDATNTLRPRRSPWGASWAHELFRHLPESGPGSSLRIDY